MKRIHAAGVAGALTAALALSAPVALAQEAPTPRPDAAGTARTALVQQGDLVRIRADALGERRREARVMAVRSDTLVLQGRTGPGRTWATTRVPVSEIRTLDVAMGTKSNAWHGAKVGGAVGGGLGLLFGLLAYSEGQSCSGDWFCLEYGPEIIPAATIGGVFWGGLLGLGIGALSHSPRWVPVAPDVLAVDVEPRAGGAAVVARVPLRF